MADEVYYKIPGSLLTRIADRNRRGSNINSQYEYSSRYI